MNGENKKIVQAYHKQGIQEIYVTSTINEQTTRNILYWRKLHSS